MALGGGSMAHQIRAWRNETRAWRRAMLKTPRPNTEIDIFLNQKYLGDGIIDVFA